MGSGPLDEGLRAELLAMAAEDQAARSPESLARDGGFPLLGEIDRRNSARLAAIIAAHGWPGKSLASEDGAHAAWLLAQHADHDVALQRACLALLHAAVASGEATAADEAYLIDRVAVREGRKQIYGTQFDEHREPQPIDDPEHVDERRRAVGLGTLEEYRAHLLETYGPGEPR